MRQNRKTLGLAALLIGVGAVNPAWAETPAEQKTGQTQNGTEAAKADGIAGEFNGRKITVESVE